MKTYITVTLVLVGINKTKDIKKACKLVKAVHVHCFVEFCNQNILFVFNRSLLHRYKRKEHFKQFFLTFSPIFGWKNLNSEGYFTFTSKYH